jgi:hypothetical protein
MALTANRDVDRFVDQELRTMPVKGGAHIFRGGFLGMVGGFVRGLVGGDACVGVAYEEADNSGGADGAVLVRVFTMGDFEHDVAEASRANNGAVVYAVDDGSVSLNSSGNSPMGNQIDAPSAGRIVFRLRPWMR